jgi:hypothetical protein
MTGVRISRGHADVALSDRERDVMRAHFAAHRWLRLPQVLSPELLHDAQRRLASAEFIRTVHSAVDPPSVDLSMAPNALSALLELLFNDPALWRLLEDVTRCARIARFGGFVYRLDPTAGLHHNWHDDMRDDRLLAMSVNLGHESFEGGTLLLRDERTGEVIGSVANTGIGDAVIFQIAPGLRHRVLPVTRGVRTAFAGWFCGGESYGARLRRAGA